MALGSQTALHSLAVLPLPRSREVAALRPRTSGGGLFVTPAPTARFFTERAERRLATDDACKDTTALAMPDFDRAVALDPTSIRARHARGLALACDGQLVDALADFDRAAQSVEAAGAERGGDEASGAVFLARGYARQRAGRLLDALADFGTALRCSPAVAEHYIARATCLRRLGRYAEAIGDYNAARCLRLPRLFAAYRERYRITVLTAEKVVLISRKICEDQTRNLGDIVSRQGGGKAADGRSQAGERRAARVSLADTAHALTRRRHSFDAGSGANARALWASSARTVLSNAQHERTLTREAAAAAALAAEQSGQAEAEETAATPATASETVVESSAGAARAGKGEPLAAEVVERCLAALAAAPEQRSEANSKELLRALTRGFGVHSTHHQLAAHFGQAQLGAELLRLLELRWYARGERLASEHEPQAHALFVLGGRVRLSCAGAEEAADGEEAPPSPRPPPPVGPLEARGFRHVEWERRADASVELHVELLAGDCIGGAELLQPPQLRARLADGLAEPEPRVAPCGLRAVALERTACIAIPLAAVEAAYLRARDGECAAILEQLCAMQLFKQHAPPALLRLARLMDVRSYARGAVLTREGGALGDISFIHAGQCRLTRLVHHAEGAPPTCVELGTLWAFQWFNEAPVLDDEAAEAVATVTALTAVTVYALPARHADELASLRDRMRTDFEERYLPDPVLLARRGEQASWRAYKAQVVRGVVRAKRRA